MKSRHGTASDGDAHTREKWYALHWIVVCKGFGRLRHITWIHKYTEEYAYCHKKDGETKYWIYLTYEFVDRQHGGKEIVEEDDYKPEGITTKGSP